MTKKMLYRITFSYLDAIYEIYARKVCESDMFGFLEVEDFVFGETTSLVVDPSEERLKVEFNGVQRTFIPMHSVFRIDEVNKKGTAKVRDKASDSSKISMFPIRGKPQE
ncbi:DUF1820 family protein [Legionella oakridgensis]|uniref:DUF1820 domain-containing protein n=2 Tax=Legionella oakridgensis TaxID=29423 RepID=W0BF00_9GAMM|nr:DUF1820 family protein [Legionella oakridgensis]AHE67207.1 hypothetical protein Loa_01660 [Legionella oakridgensis ATCC 33761 = DSM 21215]ETO93171.1 hypothetical protein LOR_48c09030 [Legionella oakridgensis RV-2-2007]KTD37994.1 hypothetical protein Loak_1670 [Legionella oakridgensis]STY20284.1 Uncharacterized protein conserved in bacteria [Legionella longbeachae]